MACNSAKSDSIPGGIHLISAAVALLTGTVVLLRTKGDLLHRRVGYVYAGSMLVLNLTAFMIFDLFGGFGPFHVAGLVCFGTLTMALIPAWRRKPGWLIQHYYFKCWSVVGLYAAFIAETGVRLVPWGAFWWVVFGSLAVVMAGGSWLIKRNEPADASINKEATG